MLEIFGLIGSFLGKCYLQGLLVAQNPPTTPDFLSTVSDLKEIKSKRERLLSLPFRKTLSLELYVSEYQLVFRTVRQINSSVLAFFKQTSI